LKREAEKLTALQKFILSLGKERQKFLLPKETKTSNDTCNLFLFSIKKNRKVTLFKLISLFLFCTHFLFFSHAPCENFFRPRAKSTFPRDRQHSVLSRHLGESRETCSFPALLAKKNSRIDRRFAAYARLKNKKSAREGTTRQKQRPTTKTKHTITQNKQQRQMRHYYLKIFSLIP
jgi:hypothetical protein